VDTKSLDPVLPRNKANRTMKQTLRNLILAPMFFLASFTGCATDCENCKRDCKECNLDCKSCKPDCKECNPQVDCNQCSGCPNCQPEPGGGNGIPYFPCVGNDASKCTQANLSKIDPGGDLKLGLAGCEDSWCRAYHKSPKVCLSGDKIMCGLGGAAGGTGVALCTNGNWGACGPGSP